MPISRIESNSIAPSQTLTTPIIATTMGVGGATPSGSGSGITFPATQSASTDANTLDDYEEGTWTPVLSFSGSGTGITYSNQIGNYTKIGNVVRIFLSIQLSNKGSSSGTAVISGCPFSTPDSGVPLAGIYGTLTGISSQIIPYISGSTITLELLNTGSQSGLLNTNVTNTSTFYLTTCFRVS